LRAPRLAGFILALYGAGVSLWAAGKGAGDLPDDLTGVSLEDLSRIRITSVAKKEQSLSKAAAAVFVVTAEDIRRMGATSIPEALRFAPGVQVARIDAGKWAVSVRGFNGRFSNKLLVLIDGRPIYSPLFASVFWEMYDIPMDDVERIEVVRGPGATMWGANAVNGVINVITKPVSETQGGSASVQAGSYDGPLTTIRYGGKGVGGAYRVFAKTQQHLASPQDGLDVPVRDGWRSLRVGFRYEAAISDRDQIEILGGAHRMDGEQRTNGPLLRPPFRQFALTDHEAATRFTLARWRRTFSERSELSLRAYYDHVDKREEAIFGLATNTVEVELQHRFRHSDRLDLTWGGAYRSVSDRVDESPVLKDTEPRKTYRYASVFLAEEAQLLPEKLYLTAGVKLEENTFGGFALEPTLRLLWAPSRRTSVWAAASRAERAPARSDNSTSFDLAALAVSPTAVGLVRIVPNLEADYEVVNAYEAGFRTNWRERWSLDVALFENHYRSLARVEQLTPTYVPGADPFLLIPVQQRNTGNERSRGAELSVQWRPSESWDLAGTATLLASRIGAAGGAFGPPGKSAPDTQFSARSNWRLRRNLDLSLSALRYGAVDAIGVLHPDIVLPGYVRGDARLEWRRPGGMRLSVGVQDAFPGGRHEIYPESSDVGSPVRRNVYGRVEWGF
jgi:iron complex outermembrane receptor protein